MSAQFGRWNFDGAPVDPGYLEEVQSFIAPYGPDGGGCHSGPGIAILYQAFHTTEESRSEIQPHISLSGAITTWNGRLDNREDLIRLLNTSLAADASDVQIVAAAYERWSTGCFAKFLGDWAVSIWDARERSLILAKDPIGTRHLHYTIEDSHVLWSTVIDPLVLLAGRPFDLAEEYVAGWLSSFPAAHLTPYSGVQSVSPSSFVIIRDRVRTVSKYWDFDPRKSVRYGTDSEYEEHFRFVFSESVRRRLRSDATVVAELSGGVDSSSIVCVADLVIASGRAKTSRLDTVSYYSDDEPSWNDRPYFTRVETQRGRAGCHIDVGQQYLLAFQLQTEGFAATPASRRRPTQATRQFGDCLSSRGSRVLLVGTGGDEVTGGVPTPIPELADLLTTFQFQRLAHQLKAWALNGRKPWPHLLFETLRRFFPLRLVGVSTHRRPPEWLHPDFAKRHRATFMANLSRLEWFGPLPSFQDNLNALEAVRRQLACFALPPDPLQEKRYPYLDRDLLEFLFAIPREQLVRPGQRRSLVRRALAGIVPEEILNRKRKAFVARGPRLAISSQWATVTEMSHDMVSSSLHIVDAKSYSQALEKARSGQEVAVITLLRTIGFEIWLRGLEHRQLLHRSSVGCVKSTSSRSRTIPQQKGGETHELHEASHRLML